MRDLILREYAKAASDPATGSGPGTLKRTEFTLSVPVPSEPEPKSPGTAEDPGPGTKFPMNPLSMIFWAERLLAVGEPVPILFQLCKN